MAVTDADLDAFEQIYQNALAASKALHAELIRDGLPGEPNPVAYQGRDYEAALYVSLKLRGHSRAAIRQALQDKREARYSAEREKAPDAQSFLERTASELRKDSQRRVDENEASPELRKLLQEQDQRLKDLGF